MQSARALNILDSFKRGSRDLWIENEYYKEVALYLKNNNIHFNIVSFSEHRTRITTKVKPHFTIDKDSVLLEYIQRSNND